MPLSTEPTLCLACLSAYLAQAAAGVPEPLTILHRKAEDTQLPAGSFDVVSMCLVAHELPQHATKAILKEAHRHGCSGFVCVCVCVCMCVCVPVQVWRSLRLHNHFLTCVAHHRSRQLAMACNGMAQPLLVR